MSTSLVIKHPDIDQVIAWCNLNFGLADSCISPFRYNYWLSPSCISWRFFFADADDAVMFKLVWNDFVLESVTA